VFDCLIMMKKYTHCSFVRITFYKIVFGVDYSMNIPQNNFCLKKNFIFLDLIIIINWHLTGLELYA
jgi:hypothetical protein